MSPQGVQLWLKAFVLLEHAQAVVMNLVVEQGLVTVSSAPTCAGVVVLKARALPTTLL